jgi:hypothetical protein
VVSTPRAGANVAVDLTTDQAGIVSVTPAHLTGVSHALSR